jgi:hypothetical protein
MNCLPFTKNTCRSLGYTRFDFKNIRFILKIAEVTLKT